MQSRRNVQNFSQLVKGLVDKLCGERFLLPYLYEMAGEAFRI